ncbi:hypothetical protein [Fluviicola taffensis]|uniref:DUF4625 domain-containing protein n=1 Tax=Fluviicola taffensis (strain DSM 16823 / NCIMB 13979 / RW262) TaxID=755732 RepID=F2IAX5_FLUTR|nr:hypothetical protein [Fluviicola taffensis]AEA45299.1 hypothetical protein Fluta_3327 [Fluviicola taffensis DSM 16823]
MRTFFITTILVSSLSFTACKKEKKTEEESEHEHTTALITITSPNENDTIQGDFVVTGSITGTDNLHGYQITVTNTLNDSIVYQNEVHDHLADFTINQAVAQPYTTFTPLKLEVVVALDHDGNKENKVVHFVVH